MNHDDWRSYRRGMARYYDTRHTSQSVEDLIRDIQKEYHPDHWLFPVIEDLRRAMAGRRVLELGCGSARFTWHLEQVAELVLATDTSAALLERAREVVRSDRVAFQLLDADDVDKVEGDFDAACHFNLVNHFPLENARAFVKQLNRRLGSGALIFMGGEHYYGWRKRMYLKPGVTDFFSRREDAPEPFELVDNPFEPDDVRALVGPGISDVHIGDAYGYWWTRYTVA